MESKSIPTVTIFGATGGTGLAFLRCCLTANVPTTVLARTPSKLYNLLKTTTAPPNLRIITGNINNPADVKAALTTPAGEISDIIVSGIGFVPDFSKGFTLDLFSLVDDVHICENGTQTIIAAIEELKGTKNPQLIVLSSTGLTTAGRDIPLLMIPLYHVLLAAPHRDKKAMEDLLHSQADGLRWIVIRPSFLLGDGATDANWQSYVRVGVERRGTVEREAIGYAIRREDVGNWMFTEWVEKREGKYDGSCVTLTY